MAEEIKKSVEKREITAELQESYLDYAMSVIVSRALPDIRDGLKPVQRRILWNMWESGLTHSAKFRKSANVVGEVLGRYHPHSDTAVYDTMVRMAQDFSLRYPLIDGQGNFGSIDGDSAAAYRYTEARLSKIAGEMLEDIQKETVDWMPNYDGQRQEPKVLPGKLPNLLLNGTVGIAVGMATNIPPHNLNEIAEAILYLSENPDAGNDDLLKFVKGPDFPTGGVIFDEKVIKLAYSSGKGSIVARAKATIEERKNKQFDIIITEIPYQVNKSELIKNIAELAEAKKIEGIRDIRDESDREGLRIVIELKNDAVPQKVLNQLYKHTALQKDFHLNMLALVDGLNPRILSLREILAAYLDYRKIVVRRRTEFDLKETRARAHILEGLIKALSVIDKIIATIKKSKDKDDAHTNLMKGFKLSDLQATAILEMRLQTLAALEREKIETELKEKKALILELESILKSPAKLLKIIKDEIKELQQKYGDDRKTEVVRAGVSEFKEEDLVPQEEAIISLSANGYIKRLPPDTFHAQRRGGKGLIGSEVGEEDFITHFAKANTHDNLLFFTNRGRVFQTKVYEIPVASRISKGKAIHNFLELPVEENITALISYADSGKAQSAVPIGRQAVPSLPTGQAGDRQANRKTSDDLQPAIGDTRFLVMATKGGVIKKTAVSDFENIRRTGIIAISLQKDDSLNWVRLSSGSDQMIVTTKKAQSIRFKESQVRPMGRSAAGIRAIKLKKDDSVAGFDIIEDSKAQSAVPIGRQAVPTLPTGQAGGRQANRKTAGDLRLLVVMENGFAKQTPLKEYKLQNRGGSGIKTANITSKTGSLVSAQVVADQNEIFALSSKGQMIRTQLEGVRMTGRAAQGVKIMNLAAGDKLAGIVVI